MGGIISGKRVKNNYGLIDDFTELSSKSNLE
jgi:hypothetical protein